MTDFLEATAVAIALLVGSLMTGFWLWMFYDCATSKVLDADRRTPWLLVTGSGHWIGAALYYFWKRQWHSSHRDPQQPHDIRRSQVRQ